MRRRILLIALAAFACGAPADDAPAGARQPSISSGEPRVPLAPTAAD